MKAKFYILAISIFISITGNCQFIPIDVNYTIPPINHYPQFISVVNESNVWLGTLCNIPYSQAVHTNDGGSTWEFNSIPVPGSPVVSGLFAVDANTCFYVFTDGGSGGSIWKTSDGGSTWSNKTTTQFSEPGAYANFYAAFDANEGIAMGDPNLGYFEIQRTTDGGQNWTRVDSGFIPPVLPGEMGAANVFSVNGDIIWFPSLIPDGNGNYSSRCFKSVDRGQHWTVSPIIAENLGFVAMSFSGPEKGMLIDPYPSSSGGKKAMYLTSDGGNYWMSDSLSIDLEAWSGLSAVGGMDGAFVVATNGMTGYSTNVLFTPDFFSTIVAIDSNLAAIPFGINFKDATKGWLEGIGNNTNALFKFNGLLTSIKGDAISPEKLAIIPNPTSAVALVKIPEMSEGDDLTFMIYSVAGNLLENRPIESNTGWTKLDASVYANGVYFIQVFSGDQLIAVTKWMVHH